MITPENFADALRVMGFVKSGNSYEKDFPAFGTSLKADLKAQKLIYPDQIKGRDRNDFYDESHKENLVVFECVNRLLEKVNFSIEVCLAISVRNVMRACIRAT